MARCNGSKITRHSAQQENSCLWPFFHVCRGDRRGEGEFKHIYFLFKFRFLKLSRKLNGPQCVFKTFCFIVSSPQLLSLASDAVKRLWWSFYISNLFKWTLCLDLDADNRFMRYTDFLGCCCTLLYMFHISSNTLNNNLLLLWLLYFTFWIKH